MTDAKLATVAPHGVVPRAALRPLVVAGPQSLPERIGAVLAAGPAIDLAAPGVRA